MVYGPVDVLVVRFEQGQFHGQLAAALGDLVERGIIHIIDLVFISKDNDGNVSTLEIDGIDAEFGGAYSDLEGEYGGMLSEEDLEAAAEDLPPGFAAGLLAVEHVWARGLVTALRATGGEVVEQIRIPAADVEAAAAALEVG